MRMKNGTPDQRQFSISRRSAAYVSGRRVGGDAVDPEIALVLPADVVRGSASSTARNSATCESLIVAVSPRDGGSIAVAATTCIR